MTRVSRGAAPLLIALAVAGCGGSGAPAPEPSPTPTITTVPIPGAPTLVLRIAGPAKGSDYDTLTVGGRATLSGNLQVRFTDGFTPTKGQSFTLVEATSGIGGQFETVNTQGVAISITYRANDVGITIL